MTTTETNKSKAVGYFHESFNQSIRTYACTKYIQAMTSFGHLNTEDYNRNLHKLNLLDRYYKKP
jgi:hypothetical protein